MNIGITGVLHDGGDGNYRQWICPQCGKWLSGFSDLPEKIEEHKKIYHKHDTARVGESMSNDILDEFVERSPQGTIFSTSKWLALYDAQHKIDTYWKGNNAVAMLVVFETPQPATPFQGILIGDNTGMKPASIISLHNEVAEALMSVCPSEFCNHYTFPDIRPFLWKGWQAYVKYTYVVDLHDMGKAWDNLEKQTRYEIKHTETTMREKPDIEEFDRLYNLTFERKGLKRPISSDFIRAMTTFEHGLYMTDDGEAGVLMIRDPKRSYYIFGASRGEGGSSYCLWNALLEESKYRKEVDLVGCNSPKIGLFKRGFSGCLKPYYGVKR